MCCSTLFDNCVIGTNIAETENVMLMFHEDQKPRRIIFNESTYATDPSNSFVADEIPFVDVPKYDYNDSSSPTPIPAEQP